MLRSHPLRRLAVALAVAVALLTASATPAWASSPPGRQSTGYGSTAGYLSAGATRFETGSAGDGSRVWWWVPTTLREGDTAPVVIYLHGFSLADPEPYQPHIDHLTRQGYIVVYPQFNLSGLGIFSDNDQNQMLARAIAATQAALGSIGAQAGDLHLFGHSLGGLLASAWMGRGGPAVDSVTLANPSIGGGAPAFVSITPIDWQQAAPATTARTMILTGDGDTIAAPAESLDLFGALTGAPSRVVYQAHTDRHGSPGLDADHMSPIQSSGGIPNFLLSFFGGTAEQDAMDWRYYWAALDANLDGQPTIAHQMGAWSDSVTVAAPSVLASDVPDPSSAIAGTVTDAVSGAPVPGAFVAVLRTTDFSLAGGAVADGSGNYSAAVAPGSYFVYVIDATGAHAAGFHGPPTMVTVPAGTVVDVDPAMAPTRGSISGTVTEEGTGNPVANALVVALTNGGTAEIATVADASGDYTIAGLRAGNHFVGFVDPAGNHRSEFWPNSLNVPDATTLAVTAGGTTTADSELPTQSGTATGSLLTGTIVQTGTSTPLEDVVVLALHATDFRLARAATTNAAGQYSLDVQAGLGYKLAFYDSTGLHGFEWHDNQPNTGLGAATTVNAPAATNASLDRNTGSVSGTITDQISGDPLEGAWVFAIGPTGIAGGAVAAPNGTYTIAGLAPGTYRATFVDPNGGRAQEYFDNSVDFAGATPFNITAATTTPNINAALAQP